MFQQSFCIAKKKKVFPLLKFLFWQITSLHVNSDWSKGVLYFLTSVWVQPSPNASRNSHFSLFVLKSWKNPKKINKFGAKFTKKFFLSLHQNGANWKNLFAAPKCWSKYTTRLVKEFRWIYNFASYWGQILQIFCNC